jgi:UDP-GlcNAc:undecaprenyl-phosphate/decaprenyl-phosphate GlcNAc-1-phosphate transferase
MLLDGRPETISALFAFLIAGVLAWTLVPLTEKLAWRIGAIDYPRERSLHVVPTPKLGGLAILVGVLVAGALFLPTVAQTRAILGGAAVIAALGVLDDVFELGALLKLAGQVVAASIPVFNGVRLAGFTLPFFGAVNPASVELFELPLLNQHVDLGHVLTIIGIVAVINVINFIDGVDGLAAGVCVISATTLAIIALSLDRTTAAVLAACTAGGALGFLRHGFPPASSFMGDTGSNLLGYLLATVAVQGALKTNAVVALFFPLLVLAVPILDTGFVVAKRVKYRTPIYRADRWHFHHRMANIGFSQRKTLAYMYAWTAVMAGLALALRFVPYSDDHGNFDALWTVVMLACFAVVIAASFYLVVTLEILKLRRSWLRRLAGVPAGDGIGPEEVDEGVVRELETGSFEVVDPRTGEYRTVDAETGEFEAVSGPE